MLEPASAQGGSREALAGTHCQPCPSSGPRLRGPASSRARGHERRGQDDRHTEPERVAEGFNEPAARLGAGRTRFRDQAAPLIVEATLTGLDNEDKAWFADDVEVLTTPAGPQLQILCDDEITRREQVAMGRRLRRAHFDTETTLEGFDFSANPKLPAAQIRDLAALRWLQAGESIILYGAGRRRQDPRRPGHGAPGDPRRRRRDDRRPDPGSASPSITDDWRTRPPQPKTRSPRTDSAPYGIGVKAKPSASTFGRTLTPTPHRRLSAPSRETGLNRSQPSSPTG